jgi:hypothetical protein
MPEWWSYGPEDFLLFAPRTYWRLVASYQAGLWPLPAATVACGLALLGWGLWRPAQARRWVLAALAGLWLLVGLAFVGGRYASINWAAAYMLPLFVLQSARLVLAALRDWGAAPMPVVGGALAAWGVALHLVLAPVAGRDWGAAEVFGLMPDPTAIATLGLVLLSGAPGWLLVLPVVWCVAGSVTLWAMGEPFAWVPALAAGVAVAAAGGRVAKRLHARPDRRDDR